MTSCRPLWLMLLAACGSQPPPAPSLLSPWSYADLRLLDPADAAQPSHDLAAVYLRRSGADLQLRLDLLSGVDLLDYDLYLALQAAPGGTRRLPIQAQAALAWDTLLVIPAAGPLQALTPAGAPRPGVALSVFRDPAGDAILISLHLPALLSGSALPAAASPLLLQVFLTPSGSTQLADQTSVLRSNDLPPAPANLLLAFWDVYPAYTPATALRRWDGAHTGSLGGRHGLYNLLRTAQAAGVPLVLLDLKDPASLSALDYASGLDLVRQMAGSGLLILPEPLLDPHYGPFDLPSSAQDALLETTKATAARFDLPASQFLYLPQSIPPPQTGRSAIFARLPLPASQASTTPPSFTGTPSSTGTPLTLLRWQGRTVIPLPAQSAADAVDSPSAQLDPSGITLAWRRRLLSAAIYANQPGVSPENTFLWLGGELPASAWGDPQSARAAFRWLVAHPWVRFLDANALLSARPAQPAPFSDSAAYSGAPVPAGDRLMPVPPPALLTSLQAAPANPLSQAAWQVYRSLYAPVYPAPPQLRLLRQTYIGQVWSLLQAAQWASSPASLSTCDLDPDHDGQPECLLASARFYAQFETADGSLTYLFAAYRPQDLPAGWPDALHQLVGPSSQFITGLSSPDAWQLDPAIPGALSADPSVIPGAFAGPGSGFLPSLDQGDLLFTSPDRQVVKTFHLDGTGLLVSYRLPAGASYPAAQIPLALDPWRRFASGWADLYHAQTSADSWSWQIQSGPYILVRASTALSGGDFSQSRSLFTAAEDPNRDFPLAHFTPFPLALLQVALRETSQISIQLIPQP